MKVALLFFLLGLFGYVISSDVSGDNSTSVDNNASNITDSPSPAPSTFTFNSSSSSNSTTNFVPSPAVAPMIFPSPPPLPPQNDIAGSVSNAMDDDNDDDYENGPKLRLHRFVMHKFKLAIVSLCGIAFFILVLAFLWALMDVGWKSMRTGCVKQREQQHQQRQTDDFVSSEVGKSEEIIATRLLGVVTNGCTKLK